MNQFSFSSFLDVVRRQWWVVVQAMLVVGVLTFLYTANLSLNPFNTRTSFLVRADKTDSSGNTVAQGPGFYTAQLRLLQSDAVMASAGEALGMTGDEVRSMITATVESTSGVVTVRATSEDPDQAMAVANEVVNAFVEDRQAQRSSNLEGRRSVLEQQLAATSQSIDETNRLIARKAEGWDNGTLTAQRTSLLSQYQTLFEDQQQVLTQIATQADIVERLDTARTATRTPRPDPWVRGALGALFLGLVIGIAIAALREKLDTRARTTEQMAIATELPLLVELPAMRVEEAEQLAMVDNPTGAFAEAVRSLQTTIRFMQQEEGALEVLAVSSAQGGDGKSTVAANLAVSFALSGYRVILVSGDLRRSTIDDRFVDQSRQGLTDLLRARQIEDQVRYGLLADGIDEDGVEHTPVSRFLQPTTTEGLLLLATGTTTKQPAELLASPQFTSLIAELREISDIVVLDCPPALVADALLLGRAADSTILVASEGRTSLEQLADAADRFRAAQVPLLGVVANRVGGNRRGYYAKYGRYRYYGRYSRYYGRSYGSTYGTAPSRSNGSRTPSPRQSPVENQT